MAVVLTSGETNDVKGYEPLMAEDGPEPKVMLADRGYDADAILDDLELRGVEPVIPPKTNRKVQRPIDGHLYALRNLVERCFSKLKHSRRLATRYDKTADSYLGFILIASAEPMGQALRQQDLEGPEAGGDRFTFDCTHRTQSSKSPDRICRDSTWELICVSG